MSESSRPSGRGRYVPWAVATGAAVVGAQGYYAGHRPLPHFEDLDGSTPPPADPTTIRIAALGDSTMTGPGLDSSTDIWFHQALADVADRPYAVTSFAKGGAKTRDVAADQLPRAAAGHPDLALVSVGSNDAIRGVPLPVMQRELETVLDGLTGAVIVMLGIGDMATIPRLPQPLATFARARAISTGRMQRRVAAARRNVLHVSMYDLAGPVFRTTPGLFAPDLFHPNVAGHRVWADATAPTIGRAIRHLIQSKEPSS